MPRNLKREPELRASSTIQWGADMKAQRSLGRSGFASFALMVLALLLTLLGLAAMGVWSYFHLSSDTRALRNSLVAATGSAAKQKLAVNVGWWTTTAARLGAGCLDLPEEARTVVQALRGAEVGIYTLENAQRVELDRCLAAADQAMKRQGWERVVGVLHERELVGVYLPRQGLTSGKLKCCVLVLQGEDLVVVQAKANLEPLMELALKKARDHRLASGFAR